MKTSQTLSLSVLLAALLAGITLAPAAVAHANPALEQALKQGAPGALAAYQRTLLNSQLASHYRALGEADKARHYFTAADQSFATLEAGYLRDHAAGHLANEYAGAGDFARARQSLNSISDLAVRTHAGWKVVAKLGKAERKEDAARLLTHIEGEVRGVQALPLLAELLTGTGANYKYVDPARGSSLVFEAYGISRSITEPADKATMLNELGANFIDIGRKDMAMRAFAEAESVASGIADPLRRAQAFAMHGGELAEKGERQRAVPALEKALAAAMQAPDDDERREVLSEIARNFGQSWAFEAGLKVADAIPDPYQQAEAYIRISKNMYKSGKHAEARTLLERTGTLASAVANPVERATVMRKLASEWTMLKDAAQAKGLLEQIESIVRSTDLAQRS